MTRDMYLDMCEQLGTEPIDSEIPVDYESFDYTIQIIFELYGYLSDRWEGMSGVFMGKDYSIIFSLFELYSIDVADQKLYLQIMSFIDSVRSDIIAKSQKQKELSRKKP